MTKQPLTQTEIQLNREICQEHFYDYVLEGWDAIEPAKKFVPGHGPNGGHIHLVADILECISIGKGHRRTAINIPARNMKSRLASVMWPTWEWATNPARQNLTISYSASLANDFLNDRITLISSDWYQTLWGHMYSLTRNRDDDIINNQLGRWYSAGLDGTITGKGGDIIILDDPMNPKKAWSEAERTNANREFSQTVYPSRLNDKINGAVLIIMQRLHGLDTTAYATGIEPDELTDWHIQKNGWDLYRLAAIAEQDEKIYSPLTGELIMERKEGEPLWPEFEPLELLLETKATGDYRFQSQWQQRPGAKGGSIIKRDWIQFYDSPPAQFDWLCQSWDLTFKGTEKSDWVVGQSWGKVGPDYFLINQARGKWGFNDQLKYVLEESESYYGRRGPKLVEQAANGEALVATLQEYIDGLKLWPVTGGSKENRMEAQADLFETHHVFVPNPEKHPWVKDWISEITIFPNGAHDDQVDACSQALQYLRSKDRKPGLSVGAMVRNNLFIRSV